MLRETDHNKTRVLIDKSLHPALEGAKRIGEPRIGDQTRLLSKTIDILFS
jgi:hypothetical protein